MSNYAFQPSVEPPLPAIDVMKRDDGLLFALFGPENYAGNSYRMTEPRSNRPTLERVTFRPADTSETIDYLAKTLGETEKDTLLDRAAFFQCGRIVKTSEGVYVNVPLRISEDESGLCVNHPYNGNLLNPRFSGGVEINGSSLSNYLNKANKINGIWILPNREIDGFRNFAFAPYESFKIGEQETEEFVRGGLARALEHTEEKVAQNLRKIILTKFGKNGAVDVSGFPSGRSLFGGKRPIKIKPVAEVLTLDLSRWAVKSGGMGVYGHDWCVYNGNYFGFAVGVSEESLKPQL